VTQAHSVIAKGLLEGARRRKDVIRTDITEMWTGLKGRGNRGMEVITQRRAL